MTGIDNFKRAEVLTQALPYIQKYYNKIVVIKYGGNAMVNEELKRQVMDDIILLGLIGVKVVLVHGGGPEITEVLEKFGKKSVFVDGLRVTDRETAEIVKMVLAGKVNKNIVNLIQTKGGNAIGICGIDGRLIEARRRDEVHGFVGEITRVNVKPIMDLLQNGYIPVVSTVGCDKEGNIYNINADTAAAYIAGAMCAERLMTLTDIAGVLRDVNDPSSLIHFMNVDEARAMIKSGAVSGGMIPKIQCCIDAIELGVRRVTIIDGRVPHSLLIEMLTDEGAGTMIAAADE
ncbi:MAG TPA: acetylglutamate kinase [Clostridiales bacterium]|jgi:acetylglutamate kinase|nr:acetylglutamate kinase [Clostridiales bacterium]